jgi:hypothetical protein
MRNAEWQPDSWQGGREKIGLADLDREEWDDDLSLE